MEVRQLFTLVLKASHIYIKCNPNTVHRPKTSSANTRSTSSANRSSSTIKNSAAALKSTANKGGNYNAFRITGLSKDDANSIMNYELENGRAFCYRVYNSEALSQDDGHTILCTERLLDGTYTYSNCATGQKNYQTNKPLSDQYKNKKYYERSNNIEVIVDATNRNVKKINEGE